MAIFGWATAAQATVYTRDADRGRLVAGAMSKRDPSPRTDTERVFPTAETGPEDVGVPGEKIRENQVADDADGVPTEIRHQLRPHSRKYPESRRHDVTAASICHLRPYHRANDPANR